ncbi:Abi family protein [uncultured Dysosmobacter sp.]|uniref:Abi family protein n=1 Tax=uncultured Dysosmobacter sp. TaxID=2591384 RepID=UPI0026045B08|nr:Abi family protein [uncultured Dysosmobacter sp.]
MKKIWIGEVLRDCESKASERPKLTIPQQVAYMRDVKGIKFNIVDETHAEEFLRENNYYFKIKAFEKNYSKYTSGENAGKYYELEFAYLQELSTLDMYLREIVLSMTLDIEHYLKVQLLKNISDNTNEDGYSIVSEFLSMQPQVSQSIQDKAENSYCEDLIRKYSDKFAIWTIVEVLSFGDLLNLCGVYYGKYPNSQIKIGNFRIVKFLRNAAAHNNCLINNLADNSSNGFTQNREANGFVSSIGSISSNVRRKKMGNRFVHDFVVMLCCFNNIVSSPGVKKYQLLKLKDLIDSRFTSHRDYFSGNMLLCSNYDFIKKVVDKFAESCV